MQTKSGTTTSALIGGAVAAVGIVAALAAFFLMDAGRPLATLGPEFDYDLSEYAAIDPALILYAPRGEAFSTGLSQSRTIAVAPDGTLWVAGDRRLVNFSTDGQRLRAIDCEAEPTCVATGDDGRVYAGLVDHIVVFDANGDRLAVWDRPHAETLLTSLAVVGDEVFAADAGNKHLWRFDKDGQVVSTFGARNPDRNHPGFILPSPYGFQVAVAPDGLLRVLNTGRHLVEAWTVDGHREWWWGEPSIGIEGFSGCCNPAGLAILPNGHIITSEKGLIRIKEYDDMGNFLGVVAGPEQLGSVEPLRVYDDPRQAQVRGFGVATDADGQVYVLDVVRNVIRKFERTVARASSP